jgi:hypothetical protein
VIGPIGRINPISRIGRGGQTSQRVPTLPSRRSAVQRLGGETFGRTGGGVRRPSPNSRTGGGVRTPSPNSRARGGARRRAPNNRTGNRKVNAGPFLSEDFPHNRFHREIRSIPSHLRITRGRAAQPRCRTGVATGTLSENATNEAKFDKLQVSHNNKTRLRLRQILALIRDLTRRWLSGDRGWSPRGNRRMLVRRWTPMAAVEMKRRMFANKTEKRLVRR